jgi:hypothetical protein
MSIATTTADAVCASANEDPSNGGRARNRVGLGANRGRNRHEPVRCPVLAARRDRGPLRDRGPTVSRSPSPLAQLYRRAHQSLRVPLTSSCTSLKNLSPACTILRLEHLPTSRRHARAAPQRAAVRSPYCLSANRVSHRALSREVRAGQPAPFPRNAAATNWFLRRTIFTVISVAPASDALPRRANRAGISLPLPPRPHAPLRGLRKRWAIPGEQGGPRSTPARRGACIGQVIFGKRSLRE